MGGFSVIAAAANTIFLCNHHPHPLLSPSSWKNNNKITTQQSNYLQISKSNYTTSLLSSSDLIDFDERTSPLQNPLFLHPSYGPHSISVPKLQGASDYRSWKRSFEIQLDAKRKLGFVTGTVLRSEDDDTNGIQWDTCNNLVNKEIQRCYQLINRLGRGVVYLGSSRLGGGHPHYNQSLELAREVANLLDCTSWSGVGPGLMDAVTQGATEAGKAVGGFKIAKEAGEWTATNFHPYLQSDTYLTCRFFSARKHGLVDAAVRASISDRTAVIALPGGIGTLDEIFEILTLIQLERIGSVLPVPFILMNYDSFYSKLLEFLDQCKDKGTVAEGEVQSLWKVCNNNLEALTYLAEFYDLPQSEIRLTHN